MLKAVSNSGGGGGSGTVSSGTSGQPAVYTGTTTVGSVATIPVANGGTGGTGTVNSQTSSYTFALTDMGGMIELNSASAITATIPPNASVAFPIGAQVNIIQYGAGAASIVAGSGVTIRYISTLNFLGQYGMVTAVKIGTDEWAVAGALN
jgi:hypothetical protein